MNFKFKLYLYNSPLYTSTYICLIYCQLSKRWSWIAVFSFCDLKIKTLTSKSKTSFWRTTWITLTVNVNMKTNTESYNVIHILCTLKTSETGIETSWHFYHLPLLSHRLVISLLVVGANIYIFKLTWRLNCKKILWI